MPQQQKQIPLPIDDKPPSAVPIRMEVDTWWTSKDQIHVDQQLLFIEALLRFQARSPKELYSYFQIAGIHGQPWTPWNEEATPATPSRGYCTHGSILFPTWHRPYLILYETTIQNIMLKEVIPSWPDQQGSHARFTSAAKAWRLPYWDWAEQKPNAKGEKTYVVPKIVRDRRLVLPTPVGPKEVRNPMYNFEMPGKEPMGKYGIHSYPSPKHPEDPYAYSTPFQDSWGTSRYVPIPDGNKDVPLEFKEGYQDNDEVEQALQGHEWYQTNIPGNDTLAEAVYRFFTEGYFSAYEKFATAAFDNYKKPRAPEYHSIESVHNNVHNWIGGQGKNAAGISVDGHMTEVPISAFDPIFWMHHANIDRQFAIWQELYPGSWFMGTKQKDHDGTYSIPRHTIDSPSVLLRPFNTPSNTPYNSDMIRYWYSLDYTYPELQPWSAQYSPGGQYDRSLYIKDIKAKMTALYSSTRDLWLNFGDSIGTGTDAYDEDYLVNVIYDKFELYGTPYTIHIELADMHAGSVYNFSARLPTPEQAAEQNVGGTCGNCEAQRKSKQLYTGQVPITAALIKLVRDENVTGLNAIKVEDVRAWLKDNLSWRVTVKGHPIPISALPSLQIAVAAGRAHHYQDETRLSAFEGYEYLYDATEGKEGGATTPGPGMEGLFAGAGD